MFGASIGRGAMKIINAMVRSLASAGVHPNILTAIGVSGHENYNRIDTARKMRELRAERRARRQGPL